MTKNQTSKQRIWELEQKAKFQIQQELLLIQRIEKLEQRVLFLQGEIDTIISNMVDITIQAGRGESAWHLQQPIGGKEPKQIRIPSSPEFPDMGYFLEPETKTSSLKERIK